MPNPSYIPLFGQPHSIWWSPDIRSALCSKTSVSAFNLGGTIAFQSHTKTGNILLLYVRKGSYFWWETEDKILRRAVAVFVQLICSYVPSVWHFDLSLSSPCIWALHFRRIYRLLLCYGCVTRRLTYQSACTCRPTFLLASDGVSFCFPLSCLCLLEAASQSVCCPLIFVDLQFVG